MRCTGPTEAEMEAYYKATDPDYRTPAEKRQDKYNNLKKYSDKTTQYLCYMIGESKLDDTWDDLPIDIRVWSERHDDIDQKRIIQNVTKLVQDNPHWLPKDIVEKMVSDALKVHPLSEYHRNLFRDTVAGIYDKYCADQNAKMENIG